MGLQILFSVFFYLIAAAHAGQLSLQSPKLTVVGPNGAKLRSESYATSPVLRSTHTELDNANSISLQNSPDPVVLGASDTLKLTFQVTDQTTDNGVQPHQTFLRFFDPTTGEEGIQPVKVTPSGKAKFELVRCFQKLLVPLTTTPLCRTWPNPRALSRPLAKRHCTSPFFLAPSCTALPHSTFSTSKSRRPHLRPCTQTNISTICAPSSHILSNRSRSCPLVSCRPSSRHSSSLRGLFFLFWCVHRLFVQLLCVVADHACGHSGALFGRACPTSSPRASSLSCFLSLSLRVYCFGIGSNSVSVIYFCMVRALLHSLLSPVSRHSWALLRAGPVAESENVTGIYLMLHINFLLKKWNASIDHARPCTNLSPRVSSDDMLYAQRESWTPFGDAGYAGARHSKYLLQ